MTGSCDLAAGAFESTSDSELCSTSIPSWNFSSDAFLSAFVDFSLSSSPADSGLFFCFFFVSFFVRVFESVDFSDSELELELEKPLRKIFKNISTVV